MSKKVNPTAVGIFVSGALVFVVLGLTILGSGKLFESRAKFVVYFQTSANGLREGSDVLLGGVKIGSVSRMFVEFDPHTGEKVIPVVIELSADRIAALSANRDDRQEILSKESISEAIATGLRARLMSQSALTGQLYIDLDFLPGDASGYTFPGETIHGLPQIPSVKNQIQQVLEVIAKSVEGLGRRDLGEILDRINSLLVSLDTKVNEFDLKAINESANATLQGATEAIGKIDSVAASFDKALQGDRLGKIATKLDETITELNQILKAVDTEGLQGTVEKANATLESLDAAAANIAKLTDSESPTAIQLNRALSEVKDAAASLKELAEFLRRNPNALVTGKKGP